MQSRKPLTSSRAKRKISNAMRGVRSQGSDTSVQAKWRDLAARSSSNKRKESPWTAWVCKGLVLIVLIVAVVVAVVVFVVVIIVSQFNLFEELEVFLTLLDVLRFGCFRWWWWCGWLMWWWGLNGVFVNLYDGWDFKEPPVVGVDNVSWLFQSKIRSIKVKSK